MTATSRVIDIRTGRRLTADEQVRLAAHQHPRTLLRPGHYWIDLPPDLAAVPDAPA